MFKNLNCFTHHVSSTTLRIVLIVPFVLQIVGTVGLVGYLSFKNGQQAVAELAEQLLDKVGEQVEHNLEHYLDIPQKINESQAIAIRTGILNWQDFSALERYFAQQLQIYPTASGIALATEKKEFLAVERLLKTNSLVIRVKNQSTNNTFQSYDADRQGRRQKLTKTRKDFDPHNDPPNGHPWYQATKQANRGIWLPVVSLSQGVDHPTLMVVNFLPFYSQDDTCQGVLGSSLFLPQFVSFLESLQIGHTGQTFIIDRQGLLIASSTGETPFKPHLDANYRRNLNPQEWRLAASNSKNTLTQESVNFLLSRFSNLNQIKQKEKLAFDFRRNRHFLRVTPISQESGLDWLMVTVVPESDFMAQIYANTRTTILLCIAAFITATGMGIITARWITKPILRLNKAAKALAKGEWDKTVVESDRSDELGQLAQSFNSMATQLQASFAALHKSENLLTHFLEALPVGVSVHDATGKLSYLNPIAKHLIIADVSPETSPEKITTFYPVYRAGTNELYPTEEMPALRSLKGETLKIDDLEIHQDEQIILLEVSSTPIFDEAGNIIYAINAFTDITERQQAQNILDEYNEVLEHQVIKRSTELININKQLRQEIVERVQVEQALSESEARFSEIARTINQFFFIRSASSGQFLYVSPAYEKLWGLSCESLYQNPLSWMKPLHPDDRELVIDSLNKQFQGNSIKREYRIIHRDGSIRWIDTEVSVIHDHKGKLLRFVGVSQDITERKRIEEALRESETRWQLAINAINAGIWDRNYKTGQVFHSVRWKEMLGYNNQETDNITEDWISRLHPDDVSFVMAAIQTHLNKQTPYYIAEYRLRGKDGSYKWILSRGQALWDEQGNLIRFVGSHEDINVRKLAEESLQQSIQREQEKAEALSQALKELKRTQAQLVQAEKMSSLGQMIAGIAHEINNPITFIQGNLTPANHYFQDLIELLELYQQTYPETSEIKNLTENIDLEFLKQDWSKLITSMQVGSERIGDIVCSLRNFSRLDEKELKLVELHEGIDNTLLILQHRLKPEGEPEIKVIKEYSELPRVKCHAKQLNQVFMNLLSNAIDALENQPEPRLITIETSLVSAEEQNSVMIRITDKGEGMNEEVLNKIFDPFFTTKPVGSGTGLGLSICYQIIVDKHNGKISCTSTLGQGTQFIVEIPIRTTA